MIRERSPNHPAGGRRRAPETGAMPMISGGGTPAETAAPTVRGRHRAPADPGRHRRADTGFLAVVPANEPPAPARPSVTRAAQTEAIPPVRRRETWTALDGDEPELLTRPMRLSDHHVTSRRPQVNGSLAGA
jgi:hypothetical protein